MDNTENGGARYPPNTYGGGDHHLRGYSSSNQQKLSTRNAQYSSAGVNQYTCVRKDNEYGEEEDEDNEEKAEANMENNESNGIQKYSSDDDDDDDDVDEAEDDDVGDDNRKNYGGNEDVDLERHPKKRKLKSLASSYEFAPRMPVLPITAPPMPKPFFTTRNPSTDWTNHDTFVLLDAWGDTFMERGRKSLRSDEWKKVAEKVSELSNIERTDAQCRKCLDTLKKKYKKEKLKLTETGDSGNGGASKWVYFKKLDMLMSSSSQQHGLSCGLDSGEYIFMNPRVYLNCANGFDEMEDSPGDSESSDQDGDSDGLPPEKRRVGRDHNEGSSFRLLADSIQKFSEIYKKIEKSKRQQMMELEKMKMDFQRGLETQKRQIMERANAEIAKIWQLDDEPDLSADYTSG